MLDPSDVFGGSLAALGSHLVVGAYQDDDGGSDQGAVWILSLEKTRPMRKRWIGPVPVWPTPIFLPIQVDAPGRPRARHDSARRVQ